jgi:hypothetical protein
MVQGGAGLNVHDRTWTCEAESKGRTRKMASRVGDAGLLDSSIQVVQAASSAFLQTSQQCTESERLFAITLIY